MNGHARVRRTVGVWVAAGTAVAGLVSGCSLILGGEPNAPVGLILEQLSSGEVHVTWVDASSGARDETGFRVERRIDAEADYTERAITDANETSYDDDSTLPGLTYWYRVAAFNDDFDSGPSLPAQITTTDHSGSSLGNVTGEEVLMAGAAKRVIVAGDPVIDSYEATLNDTNVDID